MRTKIWRQFHSTTHIRVVLQIHDKPCPRTLRHSCCNELAIVRWYLNTQRRHAGMRHRGGLQLPVGVGNTVYV